MAISFNSVVGLNSTFQANYNHASSTAWSWNIRHLHLTSSSGRNVQLSPAKRLNIRFCLSVTDGDRLATEARKDLKNGPSTVKPSSLSLSNSDDDVQPKAADEQAPRLSELSNSSTVPGNSEEGAPSANKKSSVKRSPLTAREKLRAARALNRYAESKASKPAMGSKLFDVL